MPIPLWARSHLLDFNLKLPKHDGDHQNVLQN